MHIYFTRNTLPEFVSLTWNFQSSLDELCPNLPDSFSLCISVSVSLPCLPPSLRLSHSLSLSLSTKPSHFTGAKTYVKLDPKDANTAHSYQLNSGTIHPQWNNLS